MGRRNRYRLPHLELRGTRLTASDIAALVDPAGPRPPSDRLSALTGAVATAPSVTVEVDALRPERPGPVVTVHDLALVDIVGGRVGALTAQQIDVVQQGATSEGAIRTGPVRADLLDLPLALRLAEDGRVGPETALGTLFASASVSGVELRQEGDSGRLTIAALRSGGVRARPLPVSIDATATLLRTTLDRLTPPQRRALIDGLADVAGSYEVDHVEIDGFAFDDGRPGHRTVSLNRLAVDGVGLRRSASLTLEGVALDTPDAHVTLAHAAFWGLDPSAALALARRSTDPADPAIVDGALAFGSHATAAAFDGLRITAPSADGTGNSPDGSAIIVEVPEASVDGEAANAGTRATTSSHLRLIFPLPPTIRDPNLRGLAALGLKRLEVTADEQMSLDQTNRRLAVDDVSVGASQLGRLFVSASFGNVDTGMARWGDSAEARERAAGRISLDSLSIRFANAGLVEASLPLLAASAGVSVPVLKASLKAQAAVSIAQTLGDMPAARQLNDAISTFLDEPHSIGLSLAAPGGLTLEAAQAAGDAASLLRLMTIEASANR